MTQRYLEALAHARSPAKAAMLIRASAAQLAGSMAATYNTLTRLEIVVLAENMAGQLDRAQPGDPWRTWLREAGYLPQLAKRRKPGDGYRTDCATQTGMYDHY
jgi:hypothetical protein